MCAVDKLELVIQISNVVSYSKGEFTSVQRKGREYNCTTVLLKNQVAESTAFAVLLELCIPYK